MALSREESNRKNRERYFANHEYSKSKHREYSRKNYAKYKEKKHLYNREYHNRLDSRFSLYKRNAQKRGFSFSISKEIFKEITSLSCIYCGIEANPTNGIDRKDSSIGYENGNCYPCCTRCNWMKSDSSIYDFIDRCRRIVENTKGIQF